MGGDTKLSGKKRASSKSKRKKVDAIIFSPPYAEEVQSHTPLEKRLERIEKLKREKPEVVERMKKVGTWENINKAEWNYGEDLGNIGNLPHGEIDAIVFSPPFKTASEGAGITRRAREGTVKFVDRKGRSHGDKATGLAGSVPVSKENIDSLPYGKINQTEVQDKEQVENILFFNPTAGFKGYEQFFSSESVTHPAKANLNLLR